MGSVLPDIVTQMRSHRPCRFAGPFPPIGRNRRRHKQQAAIGVLQVQLGFVLEEHPQDEHAENVDLLQIVKLLSQIEEDIDGAGLGRREPIRRVIPHFIVNTRAHGFNGTVAAVENRCKIRSNRGHVPLRFGACQHHGSLPFGFPASSRRET